MPKRSYSAAGSYRYGFNGQEMSNDIKGLGNSYTAEYWEYDSRIGRRWNTDPVDIAFLSPYSTFQNNPIVYVDPTGAVSGDPKDKVKRDEKGIPILDEVVVSAKRKNSEKMSPDEIPHEKISMPSGWTVGLHSLGGDNHRKLAEVFASSRQQMPDVSGVGVFDVDDFNTIVTTHTKITTVNSETQEETETVWTTYTIFRYDIYGSASFDVKEDDFFANPQGYLSPQRIIIDPFVASRSTKLGPILNGLRASKFQLFRFAANYGVKAYSQLKGLVSGAQVHHILEKRFVNMFPELGAVSSWPSIILTKTEHLRFSIMWRMEIGLKNWRSTITTANATRQDVIEAAKKIYKDYPEILKFIPKK